MISFVAAARPVFDPAAKTLAFAVPGLAAKGDALLLVAAYVNADSCPVPAGWTRAVHLVGTSITLDAYVRLVDDNEPSSVTLVVAIATSEWQGELVVLHGAHPGTLVEASAIGNYVAAATPNAPAVNTQQAISLELCAWSTTGANVPVPPAGFTVVDGYASALASSRSFGVGFVIAGATGALPVRGATGANPSTGSAISLVLRDRPPVLPFVLDDPVPGNIGLRAVAGDTNIALRFDEPATSVLADEIGNLDPLNTDAGAVSFPLTVPAWTGRGRRFIPSAMPPSGLIAHDSPNGNTIQQRDITIRAIVALELVAAGGNTMTLIARGTHDGSPAEQYCYGLELQEQALYPGCVEVRWLWEDTGGTIRVQPAGVFSHPGDGKLFVLSATRRVEATGRVVVRYYVGTERIAELVSVDGDIAGATTSHTTIGGRKNAGAWTNPFAGTIDELLVDALELSGDELAQEHDRLVLHQPAGVEMFVGLMPPGAPWYQDPGNNIGRLVKVAGQALGQPIAATEAMRALWLPTTAPRAQIAKWEFVCGIVPKARDSLDTRRDRVVAYFARKNGFSRPQVQAALAELLALDPSVVQILEFSNTIRDGFETLEPLRWLQGPVGAWSIAGNKLALHVAAGTDLRWEPTRAWCHNRMAIPMPSKLFFAACQLSTYALATNTLAGLWIYNRRTNNAIWFGVRYDGAVRRVGYRTFLGGVMGAFVNLAAAAVAGPEWLRVQQVPNVGFVGVNDRTYRLSWSAAGALTSNMTSTDVVLSFPDPEWVGFAAVAEDALAATAADLDVTFDDFVLRAPQSVRPFFWYAYRDPGLAGAGDLDNGNLVARRISPAHTVTAASGSKSVLCDDPLYGRCDRGPLGAV